MHTAAGQRRAPRVLLVALLVVLAALTLLGRPARAQQGSEPCNVILEDCTTTTEEETTSTTEEEPETTTTEERSTATTARNVEEVSTTSTLTVTTLHDILVPGDGTAGAESTTTTAAPTASEDGISDDTLILSIVGGLAVVAAVVGVLTYRYWHATRPRLVEARPERPGRSALLD